MSKLIVFDCDGTFLDSLGHYERVVNEYSDQNGLPRPCMRTIRLGYSDSDAHDFGWGVDKEEQRRHLIETFVLADKYAMSGEAHWTPELFSGVEDMMTHLKDLGYTLAIITSKPEAPLLHLLEYHNIYTLFSAHRTWDDIARRQEREKPEPDMLLSVMRDLNFAPEETAMVGDTTMDILMGKGARAHTVGVTWGAHPREKLVAAGADHIV